jgi:hypothetical protein
MEQTSLDNVVSLLQSLSATVEPLTQQHIIKQLGRLASGYEPAILALLSCLPTPDTITSDEVTQWEIMRALGNIANQHSQAIARLLQILVQGRPPSQRIAAEVLAKIAVGEASAIQALADLVCTNVNPVTQRWAIAVLGDIGANSSVARDAAIDRIYHGTDEAVRAAAARSLHLLDRGSEAAITAWMHFFRYETNYYIRYPIIDFLKTVAVDHPGVMTELQAMLNVTGIDKVNVDTRKLAHIGLSTLNLNPREQDNVDLFLQALRNTELPEEKTNLVHALIENGSSRADQIVEIFLEILEAPGDVIISGSIPEMMGGLYTAHYQAVNIQELRRAIIRGISRWAAHLSASTRVRVIQVVRRQLEQTENGRETTQLTGLLGQLGGATAENLETLTTLITGTQPIYPPAHIQLMAELRHPDMPPEVVDQTLIDSQIMGFSMEQKLAIYHLATVQGEGEMDAIKLLLERLVASTTDDEVITIVTTLLLQKQARPDVIETLIHLGQQTEDPIRLGIYFHAIAELAHGSGAEAVAQAFVDNIAQNHSDEELRMMATDYLQHLGNAEPSQ